MSDKFSYDQVPYQSTFQPQIYPDRMATLATILGMKPAPPDKCRYLELGCGEGDNLIAFAFSLPESDFVGIDLSARHIEAAERMVAELGLKNIRFLQKDVMDLGREEFGEFDYIAAHGLFSWVPDFVRERVLDLYAEMLAPEGVGYLSYNTLPGGYMRQMMRDMMQFHTIDEPLSLDKVEKGLSILGFLRDSVRGDKYYRSILENEIGFVTNHSPASILHDELGELNRPFYFHEFVKTAAEHGLQYLSEAEYFTMPMHEYPPQTAEALASFGEDIIRREQYIDFLRCRRFRQTLLCRAGVEIDRDVKPEKIRRFYISSAFSPVDKESALTENKPEKFRVPNGPTAELEHPLTKTALAHLGGIWVDSIRFDDLMDLARRGLEEKGAAIDDWEKELHTTCAILLELYVSGLVKLNLHRPQMTREVGENPTASSFVRWQLGRGEDVVTALNISQVKVDDSFFKALLTMLDGTRSRLDLKKELRQKIGAGEFADVGEKSALLRDLPMMVKNNLQEIADLGLLIS
ncbi:MAG: class I SAM-dependent methyltransferase [Pyrinomonadaceae bacterium]